MFRRKLKALDFHSCDTFNIASEEDYRQLIVWLEDTKIRNYKLDERATLRKITAGDWEVTLQRYLDELGCPYKPTDKAALIDWLLGVAVRAEYGDNVEKYKSKTSTSTLEPRDNAPQVISTNPLDNLNFDDPDFKNGVNKLAQILSVPKHPDHLITLQAICRLVSERFSADAMKKANIKTTEGKPFPLQESDLGFDTGDIVLNNAAKVLRLLYIHDLRDLQTRINEAIVSVQAITANPKTDSSLGKVGK